MGYGLYTADMEMGSTEGRLRSGELARLAGVSTDTLRHYERKGVLARPRRAANGYRLYPPESLSRVRLVRRALAVGFTLDELSTILSERGQGRAPCRAVRALAAAKLAEVEARLVEITALRDDLGSLLRSWDEKLAKTRAGERASLLESLAADDDGTAAVATKSSKSNWRERRKERNKNSEA